MLELVTEFDFCDIGFAGPGAGSSPGRPMPSPGSGFCIVIPSGGIWPVALNYESFGRGCRVENGTKKKREKTNDI